MKNFLLLVVAFSFFLFNCKTDETETETESAWEQINLSSVNDMAGIWENSFTVNVPSSGSYNKSFESIFDVPIPATSVFYENFQIEYIKDDVFINTHTKIVFDTLLDDTVKFNSGYTKDSLWDNLITFYDQIKDYLDVSIEKYYTLMETTEYLETMNFSYFYIHKDRKRIKMIMPLSQTYQQEVILYKK